ncbi:MAG: helix-turn-helix domain-containing protein [Bacteroidales bacterium]|nr:helix-turn-helix domain-containing protein [Bacteroidales bacterium]
MNDKRERAYQDYLNGMKYADIAKKYGVSLGTVKSWASRYNWKKVAQKSEKVARKGCTEKSIKPSSTCLPAGMDAGNGKSHRFAQNNGSDTQSSKARPGNRNAVGNKGGRGAPRGNNYRHIHGLYSLLTPTTLSEAEIAYLLSGDELQSVDGLRTAVRICDILIARHLNQIEELQRKEKITQTLTERVTTVKGIEKGQENDYVQKEISKSHVYTGEKIDKLHAEIAKQVKIKAGLLNTMRAHETDGKRFDLDERKHTLAKQRLTGEFDINPEMGEIK